MQNIHTYETNWNRAAPGALTHRDQVHVWRVSIDLSEFRREQLLALLADDELERAEKFHFKRDRDRFIAARGMLRKILGSYLGTRPEDLRFVYSFYGKPELAYGSGGETLQFNLSHSGAYALYAVTRERSVGIDIEQVRVDVDAEQISRRFFSEQEIRLLQVAPQSSRMELFYQYWTRKEAFIKAIGKGVSFPLENCDVSLFRTGQLTAVSLLEDKTGTTTWYGQDLYTGIGYAAAIVMEGGDCDLSFWQYTA